MREIIFVASHVGYPMDRTPLGGGAMVGLQLVKHWARLEGLRLTVLGSGPLPPEPGIRYHRLPGRDLSLVHLSEFGYARFCREFERATTAFLADERRNLDPRRACVVVNDISESPDVAAVAAMGYPILSIWHVDVVDFFNKIYFKNLVAPQRLTAAFEHLRRPPLGWAVPDVLRLVFEKQRNTVLHSRRLVLPSRGMADTVERCYAHLGGASVRERALVVPWGGWEPEFDPALAERQADRLRTRYQLGPRSRVLMTLSRISPEKGIHLLLRALRRLERSGELPAEDLCVFVCGERAFMQGRAYHRQLLKEAARLKRVRVFFPGYLAAQEKQAYFRLADLFVSPSIHESYGLTLVEALQAGLPVLASDHYGVEEILSPEFGRILPYAGTSDVPRALAEALTELLRDPARLREMGRRAKAASASMTFDSAARRVAEAALELCPS